jgi:hypothetical protein
MWGGETFERGGQRAAQLYLYVTIIIIIIKIPIKRSGVEGRGHRGGVPLPNL